MYWYLVDFFATIKNDNDKMVKNRIVRSMELSFCTASAQLKSQASHPFIDIKFKHDQTTELPVVPSRFVTRSNIAMKMFG